MTRRYEITSMSATGEIETVNRVAPAIPVFEEAFSAIARGTVVATEAGPVAVEDLLPGMMIQTVEGAPEELVWCGSMTIYPARATPHMEPTLLTRVTADAFGLGRPMPDLILGPLARLLFRDARCVRMTGTEAAYAPARSFVDGVSVIEVAPIAPVTVYNLVLARQCTLRAAGLEIESYHPGAGFADMIEPQMMGLFLALFPHVRSLDDFGQPAHPRLTRFEIERLMLG